MATIQTLATYLIPRAMAPREYLSFPRLVKLMYLADWRESLASALQITNVKWKIGGCGPSADEIYEQIKNDVSHFKVSSMKDELGNPKTIVSNVQNSDDVEPLTESQKAATDFILRIARNRPWESLSSLVSSTYPVATREPGVSIDLPELAAEYKRDVLPRLVGVK